MKTPSILQDKRATYIYQTLGLRFDPFVVFTREQEFDRAQRAASRDYHIDFSPTLLAAIQRAAHTLIFGEPGSGKTTLRYALQRHLHDQRDNPILAVHYDLATLVPSPLTLAAYWQHLASNLAIDLFIQMVERLSHHTLPHRDLTEAQQTAFRQVVGSGWARLQRVYQALQAETLDGCESLWPRLGRLPGRYVPASARLRQFLAAQQPRQVVVEPAPTGWALIETLLNAARAWGFTQFFVLLDGIDAAGQRTPAAMAEGLRPLLENHALLAANQIYLKIFTPADLQPVLLRELRLNLDSCIIEWDEASLRAMLLERLGYAAQERQQTYYYEVGLEALAHAEWKDTFTQTLLRHAPARPRPLLQLISQMIDAHIDQTPQEPLLTKHDLESARRRPPT